MGSHPSEKISGNERGRRQQVSALQERHHDDMLHEDAALQLREAEREQARQILKQQIDAWKKPQRQAADRQPANDTGPSPTPDQSIDRGPEPSP